MERSTVGSLLRSTQAYCQQICEKQTFDFGIAFYCDRFPAIPEANQIREMVSDDPRVLAEAFEQASAWLASRGLKCLRWSPAMDTDPKPLADVLSARGFAPRTLVALHLADWPSLKHPPEIRVVPARALRGAFRETFLESHAPADATARGMLADSFMERLDDPQLDMFVATVNGMAAGRCGLYQVGDIARILDLTVLPVFSDGGVVETLLAHVLTMARRLTIPMVVAQALAQDHERRALLGQAGFVEDGQVSEFELPSPFAAVPPV
jgi:N-acetylglutamate synthase-like GNAT family acetyltransferase